ncbi:MAG: MarR family transcriptional regulator [Paludibacterium sp.]|uniref:MarR family winged helix-turn-helix transcriptional regulator n=1 Tax=Paludibacterium sp. TaxID=1917523 RepID=UPI0025D19386|nr:MarR family transcriptional regulator [Paludibacterium sp.]MBV8047216.1 MarR family transcriptional regulator [Paludibacterium sp.]MBV8647114.1 MarR family transcriptional regulator [Paludibacterium sp.]
MTHDSSSAASDDLRALADALRPALMRLMRQLRRDSEDAGVGITPLQNLLLVLIHKQPGIGVSELARIEKLRGPTVSGHVRGLEQAGLVTRSAEEQGDRRRSGLYVTERGREALEAMRAFRTDWLAGRLSRLAPSARERLAQAIDVLTELSE